LELLEVRNLLSFTNVLVNNLAEDTMSMQDTQNETAIVLANNSDVVVAYNDTGVYSYPIRLNPNLVGFSLSNNGGLSFTDAGEPPPNPPYWEGTDPVLARSSETGTVFLCSTSGSTDLSAPGERILISRSTDNGASFAAPLDGTPGFVPGVDVADKPWITVDNYPGPGYGDVYLAWTCLSANGTEKGMFFTRSTDDGITWGPSGGVPIQTPSPSVGFQGAYLAVGPDHTVHVFWWDGTKAHRILMRNSTDQGQTFGPAVKVTGLRTHGGNGDLGLTDSTGRNFRTNALPQAVVNPVTGDIYVVFNDEPNVAHDKADIFFTMSPDGGNTWSNPLRVNDDNTTNDQWMPALAMTPDGNHVGIFWYDRRLDPADNLIDRFGVIGTVCGHNVSFAPNFRITDVSFPPAFDQDSFLILAGLNNYMGDYDMATADNNYFYTTWGDNRLSDAFFANQPDVRFAEIPVESEDHALALIVPPGPGSSAGTIIDPGAKSTFPSDGIKALDDTFARLFATKRPRESHCLTETSVTKSPQKPLRKSVFGLSGLRPGPFDSFWPGLV
jgi:hypothetical protein